MSMPHRPLGRPANTTDGIGDQVDSDSEELTEGSHRSTPSAAGDVMLPLAAGGAGGHHHAGQPASGTASPGYVDLGLQQPPPLGAATAWGSTAVGALTATAATEDDGERGSNASRGSSMRNGGRFGQGRIPTTRIPPRPVTDVTAELNEELERVLIHQKPHCNLAKLNLGDETLPRDIMQSEHINELLLAENRFRFIPHEFFGGLHNLNKVDLSNNQLIVIPESLLRLPRCDRLLLDHNCIASVPSSRPDEPPFWLPMCTVVGLSWNKFATFPLPLLQMAPNLLQLYLLENPALLELPPPEAFEAYLRTPSRTVAAPLVITIDNRPHLMRQLEAHRYPADLVRFEINKIYPDRINGLDYVFLGSVRTAQCTEVYDDLGIRFVLTCGRGLEPVVPDATKWKELPLDDSPTEDISCFFDEAIEFVQRAIDSREGVLIHCFMGLSRSVTVEVAYLISTRGMTARQALDRIRETRVNAQPNKGFWRTLEEFEKLEADRQRLRSTQ